MARKISFDVYAEEYKLINRIVFRAASLLENFQITEVAMDITAVHTNGCPLRLDELLAADNFNFLHDVVGIQRNMNRQTGKLERSFTPRFAAAKLARGERDGKASHAAPAQIGRASWRERLYI